MCICTAAWLTGALRARHAVGDGTIVLLDGYQYQRGEESPQGSRKAAPV